MVQLNQSCTLIQTILKRLEILLTACTTLQLQILLLTQSKRKKANKYRDESHWFPCPALWAVEVLQPPPAVFWCRLISLTCRSLDFGTKLQHQISQFICLYLNFFLKRIKIKQLSLHKGFGLQQQLHLQAPPGTSRHLIPLTCPGWLGRCIHHPLLAVIGTE